MSAGLVTPEEEEEAERRARPRSAVIFETIRLEGETEMERSPASLFWSAFASGLSMVFSLVTMGVLRAALPDARWTPLVAGFGYTLGFLIVILGRQQLFTENTLTPLLPVFSDPKRWRFRRLGRLWGIILVGNLIGAAASSAAVALTGAFTPEQHHAFDELARTAVAPSFGVIFAKAVFAGWVIALMVWLLPLTEVLAPLIIIILTWVISAAGLEHIIAGSVDVLYGVWSGAASWAEYGHFAIPTLLGNIVGGVGFVTAVAFAEVASEDNGSSKKAAQRRRNA
jgi:formate/nitrite transporter FocA (FNT family)